MYVRPSVNVTLTFCASLRRRARWSPLALKSRPKLNHNPRPHATRRNEYRCRSRFCYSSSVSGLRPRPRSSSSATDLHLPAFCCCCCSFCCCCCSFCDEEGEGINASTRTTHGPTDSAACRTKLFRFALDFLFAVPFKIRNVVDELLLFLLVLVVALARAGNSAL